MTAPSVISGWEPAVEYVRNHTVFERVIQRVSLPPPPEPEWVAGVRDVTKFKSNCKNGTSLAVFFGGEGLAETV